MTLPASLARKARQVVPAQTPPNDHAFIKHVQVGDNFEGVYYVELVHIKTARNGNKYTDFTLRDKSGNAFVRYWGTIDDVAKGCFVYIEAVGEKYMGNLQIVAQKVTDIATPTDMKNYLPKSGTFDKNLKVLKSYQEIQHPTCLLLLQRVFADADDLAAFVKAPASILPHYGVEGGLLAHTVCVAQITQELASIHGLSPSTSALLLTAALLHRLGAVRAFEFVDCVPVETKHGKLLGVEFLSGESVAEIIRGVKDSRGFCGEDALRILHAVNACTKRYIKPMTLEAILLAEAYSTTSMMAGAMDFMANDQNTDEEFTAYDPVLRRQFYRTPK